MKNRIFIAISVIALLSMNAVASDKVTVYFFWSNTCPHCLELDPFMEKLPGKYPQLEIKKLEIHKKENLALLNNLSEAYNTTLNSVPDVFIGNKIVVGYGGTKTENLIESLIVNCSRDDCQSPDEILQEYKSRPKITTTTSTTTTTTTSTSTTSTSTTTETTTTTLPDCVGNYVGMGANACMGTIQENCDNSYKQIPGGYYQCYWSSWQCHGDLRDKPCNEVITTNTTTTSSSTTTTKAEDTENQIQPWILGPIGIAVILLIYGLTKKKKKKEIEVL